MAEPNAGSNSAAVVDIEKSAAAPSCGKLDMVLADADKSGDTSSFSLTETPPLQLVTVPVVEVPCFFPSAELMTSRGFDGQFTMSHQAVLACVTAQARVNLQTQDNLSVTTVLSPEPTINTVSPLKLELGHPLPAAGSVKVPDDGILSNNNLQMQSPRLALSSGDDGFNWRKYGQKQVKNSDNARSYYKCTKPGCLAKKKVERSQDGRIVELTYWGSHDHETAHKPRNLTERASRTESLLQEDDSLRLQGNESNEILELVDLKNDEDPNEESYLKRRISETITPGTPSVSRSVREQKIVHTSSSEGNISDGYRWRKYGQKFIKGNTNPRSYYRCTQDGCLVRKHVEMAPDESKAFVITYEGKHNHEIPSKSYSEPRSSHPSPVTAAAKNESIILGHEPTTSSLGEDAAITIVESATNKAVGSAETLLSISFYPSSINDAEGTKFCSNATSSSQGNLCSSSCPKQLKTAI